MARAKGKGARWKRPRRRSKTAARFPKRRRVSSTGIATRDLLALAHAVHRTIGWISAKDAAGDDSQATWELIYELHQDIDAFKAFQKEHADFRIGSEDELAAEEIIEWASDSAEADEYHMAIAAAIADDEVCGGAFALVCSAVHSYVSDRDRHLSEAHVGTIGAREVFRLTLKRVVAVPNRFRTSYRLKFYDDVGNEVVWFASKPPASLGLALERACTIKATVRKHDEYLGSKQTYITRGRIDVA